MKPNCVHCKVTDCPTTGAIYTSCMLLGIAIEPFMRNKYQRSICKGIVKDIIQSAINCYVYSGTGNR